MSDNKCIVDGDVSTSAISSLNALTISFNSRLGILENNQNRGLSAMTAVTSTTGNAINFTNIPSWVKRITVLLSRVSTNGTSPIVIRLGTVSTGIFSTGYSGAADAFATSPNATLYTNGLVLMNQNSASAVHHIKAVFHNINGNTWMGNSQGMRSDTNIQEYGATSVTLTDVVDRLQVTTINGSQPFDLGIVNVFYE